MQVERQGMAGKAFLSQGGKGSGGGRRNTAQEFREARDWLKQHKRDSFLWLVIVMTLTVFTLNFVAF
jgi:hypothetical protein